MQLTVDITATDIVDMLADEPAELFFFLRYLSTHNGDSLGASVSEEAYSHRTEIVAFLREMANAIEAGGSDAS